MITFRNATLDDLKQVLGWARDEGWNPGLDDAPAFHTADPDGFFVAVDGLTPVAAISVVNHTDTFAFLGLYIVRPSYRGKGIGYGLWSHAIQHAQGRTIGLDGVPEQQDNYAASGFAHAGGTTRYAGSVLAEASDELRLAEPSDVDTLIAQEAAYSGVAKPRYLSAWFQNTENRKTYLGAEGFFTVRKCQDGSKIGPLVAARVEAAHSMIQHAATVFGTSLVIDVPETSEALATLCSTLALAPGFETARMYRGPAPVATPGLYAVTSLELS